MGGGLLDLIPAHHGHFAYTSGDHGDLWLDLDALFAHPRRLRPYLPALADLLPSCDVVCGPLTGGAYLALSVADALDTDFAWTEGRTLTGDVTGRRVAIVDDAINAGSAVSAAAQAITAAGGQVVAVAALLTLGATPDTIAASPYSPLRRPRPISGRPRPAPAAPPAPRSPSHPPEPATLSPPARPEHAAPP